MAGASFPFDRPTLKVTDKLPDPSDADIGNAEGVVFFGEEAGKPKQVSRYQEMVLWLFPSDVRMSAIFSVR
jgi:hypothetical protein